MDSSSDERDDAEAELTAQLASLRVRGRGERAASGAWAEDSVWHTQTDTPARAYTAATHAWLPAGCVR
jgi:hypothetical protein